MTTNASRDSGQKSNGTQNPPPPILHSGKMLGPHLSIAHATFLHSEQKPFNDQDDGSDLDSWSQPTLKQNRLQIWIDRLPYLGLTLCAFTAITLMVLSTLVIRRPITMGFTRDNNSYHGSPESLLYCKYDLTLKIPTTY